MSTSFEICPFCGVKTGVVVNPQVERFVAFDVSCPRCGHFVILAAAYPTAGALPLFERAKIATVLRELNLRGEGGRRRPLIFRQSKDIPADAPAFALGLDALQSMCPKTVEERIDRALLNLAELSAAPGSVVEFDLNSSGLLYAENPQAAGFLLRKLQDDGLISADNLGLPSNVAITLKGWQRLRPSEYPMPVEPAKPSVEKPTAPVEKPKAPVEDLKVPAAAPTPPVRGPGRKSSEPLSLRGMLCKFCGEGTYSALGRSLAEVRSFGIDPVGNHAFIIMKCSVCGHVQFFHHERGHPPAWSED